MKDLAGRQRSGQTKPEHRLLWFTTNAVRVVCPKDPMNAVGYRVKRKRLRCGICGDTVEAVCPKKDGAALMVTRK